MVDIVLHRERKILLYMVHRWFEQYQVEILVHKEYIDKHLQERHYLVDTVDIVHHQERKILLYNPNKWLM